MDTSALARTELLQVADAVAREKSIERDEVLEAMEQAISKAGRAKYGHEHDIRAEIDRKSGEVRLRRYREVADEVENEFTQILTKDAQARQTGVQPGEFIIDDLPPIPADSAGLHQAFLNLVTNALDAVEPETGAVTVSSKYDSMHRNVIVQVVDNGSGIPAGQVDRIFTPFYSSKGQKGTGLGLAVAKKVVEEHQGTIKVESKPSEGTTFTISLPAMPRSRDTGPDGLSKTMV